MRNITVRHSKSLDSEYSTFQGINLNYNINDRGMLFITGWYTSDGNKGTAVFNTDQWSYVSYTVPTEAWNQ